MTPKIIKPSNLYTKLTQDIIKKQFKNNTKNLKFYIENNPILSPKVAKLYSLFGVFYPIPGSFSQKTLKKTQKNDPVRKEKSAKKQKRSRPLPINRFEPHKKLTK